MLDFFKALADPTRLRLLMILQEGEFTVQELEEILQMGQSRVSRHLKILLQAGILQVHRQGTWGYYRLAETGPLEALKPFLAASFHGSSEVQSDRSRQKEVLACRGERSHAFFERHGSGWDRQTDRPMPDPSYREHLLGCLPPSRCAVEIGVGSGILLQELARRLPMVIGVDHSATMLEAAQSTTRGRGKKGVDFRLGDMSHLPLRDNEVDLVIVDMVLHHAPSPVRVLAEIRRVLQPGGTLLLADLSAHEQEWMRSDLADQWLGFQWQDLQHWLQQAGLSEVHYRQIPSGTDAPDPFLLVATRPELETV